MARHTNEPIAIVGMGCRFPGGADHPSKLWDLLSNPRDVAQTIPADRFNIDRFYHKEGIHHGTTNTRMSYFLEEDVTKFDAKFFAVPPGEAEAIDPQQRILLEVVYEALENAGIPMHKLSNSDTGVYVGIMSSDYYAIQAQEMNALPTYAATGIAGSNGSSRISYFFNWHGPSLTIDTACSSSLVGVYEAVQALRSGRCRTAAACGTNLMLSPFPYITESKLGMLSPTGRSRMWDAAADGYARGEGVACIMLKTLSSALADGDKIDCLIREVGVNHDGKTTGLTMPSATAQAALIRSVYQQAGLDPTRKEDRCQYFEAHGTGTPAGDPQEATALYKAFFSGEDGNVKVETEGEDVLYVGSIKTVIGHTEGTAGLAGLIKACLALQAGAVPPNMLFNTLNPALNAFKERLQVPTELRTWPEVRAGQPRRASVNSFGFGGTNAHAILESFTQPARPEMNGHKVNGVYGFNAVNGYHETNGHLQDNGAQEVNPACTIPVVLSAASEASLITTVKSTMGYLETILQQKGNKSSAPSLQDLAWTLSSRRSALSQRLSVPASSLEDLQARLRAKFLPAVSPTDESPSPSMEDLKPVDKLGIASLSVSPSILGVFTGQGAQWPQMGLELIKTIPMARDILSRLDASLASLPTFHRPQWTLAEQLTADKSKSRLSEAALSQPLCTAVQIILIDLLQMAGIHFRAVVGHSSGEIAAAYAAGFLSSTDAIRIAYYRGFFAKLAGGTAGQKGGMVAVGTSIEDATDLCGLEDFDDSLFVACHNSPTSVTLSGDHGSVLQAIDIFEEEGKFARALRVDTAYHSGHMMRCAAAYGAALTKCKIQMLRPDSDDAPLWFSSVFKDSRVMGSSEDGLDGQYWVNNMTNPVLFQSAVRAAVTASQDAHGVALNLNMAVEVGPHAALQGPASETILEATGNSIPYTGTLKRNTNDVESVADALGYLWSHFGPVHIHLGDFQKATSLKTGAKPQTVHDLPQYIWNHERSLWAESRSSKVFRTQEGKFHDLLGLPTTDGTTGEWRWKNVLKIKEIWWLSGHDLQGQTVLPATAYIALAMEAGMDISRGRKVSTIELLDLDIKKAIPLSEANGTELVVSLTNVKDDKGSLMVGDYSVFSNASKESSQLALNCTGRLQIVLDQDVEHQFAARVSPVVELAPVDVDRFYDTLREDLGYGYSGPFRSLTKIERRFGFSTATIKNTSFGEGETPLVFHPAMLDCALQGLNAALCAPGDGSLWSILVPAHFHRITLVPELCGTATTEFVNMDCSVTNADPNRVTGDIDVYCSGYEKKMLEIEGVRLAPFAPATSKDDRHLFQEPFFGLNEPDANLEVYPGLDALEIKKLKQRGTDAERAAFFYLKNLYLSVSQEQRERLPSYRKALIDNAERVYNIVKSGSHSHAQPDWIQDTHSEIVAMMDSYGSDDDFNLTRAVGEHLLVPQVLSGESSILEYMTKNDYLDRYYINGIGFETLNYLVAAVMQQLAHKYPHMDVLEIGAGTGGATRAIFGSIASAFKSYTYTDISSGFFEKASEKFSVQSPKMIFKVLDIEDDPAGQGYKPHSYDVIVASNVLHATKSMKRTLENTKKLLKPGGYLVLIEVIRSDVMRHGLVMGGLPGWWIGFEEGRTTGPSLTLDEWDAVLRQTGFSGLETTSPMPDIVTVPGAVIVSRALDDRVSRLMSPLAVPPPATAYGPLVIIGGSGDVTSRIVGELKGILKGYFEPITVVPRLEDWPSDLPATDLNVICLGELDTNMFEAMTEPRWDSFKKLLGSAVTMLWLLSQSQDGNAHAGTTMGLFRTLFYELPGTFLQTLDLQEGVRTTDIQASMLAELLVRLTLQAQMIRLGESGSVLFGYEPELVLHPDGRLHVPRVRQSLTQNARYNSAKREIKRSVNIEESILELVRREPGGSEQLGSGNPYMLRETQAVRQSPLAARWNAQAEDYDELDSGEESESGDTDMVTIRVSCSFLSSVKTPCGYYFVQLGTDTATGHKLLFFSDSHTSVVTVPRSFTVRASEGRPDDEIVDGQYMSFVLAELVTQQILQILPPSGTVLVYEPDPILSSLLVKHMSDLGRRAVFVSSKPSMKNMSGWTYLHQNSPQRVVDSTVAAKDTALYIDASDSLTSANSSSSQSHDLASRISKALSPLCEKVRLSSMTSSTASGLPSSAAPRVIVKLLRKLSSFATSQLSAIPDGAPLEILPLKQIVGASPPPSPYVLVYWELDRVVPVSTETVLRRRDLFRPDRTYWLAGLGGDMGRSLADFMVSNGARNVVISSRNPLVNEKWVQWHEERGAKIAYHACDLTSFESTKALHAKLVETMPPIEGVANGAMVLRDGSVVTMPYESLMTTLNSKVQSTINLNRLFSSRVLDWFVGFSSIVGTTGNAGQAAYSAGNVFMKAIIKDRRARGLAGSTIDICRVIGLGYIERESSGRLTREHQARLATRSGSLTMGELDMHQLFAEAIISGRPHSGLNPEIVTGLAPLSVEEAKDAFWVEHPRFGLIVQDEGTGSGGQGGDGSKANSVPVRQLLEGAKSMQDVSRILLTASKTKLQALMFLSDSDNLSETTPLVDMGVDSLVAVEMRFWFLKELAVDMPVMKILGGASISELVAGVVEKLPEDITSSVGNGSGAGKAEVKKDVGKAAGKEVAQAVQGSQAAVGGPNPGATPIIALDDYKMPQGRTLVAAM